MIKWKLSIDVRYSVDSQGGPPELPRYTQISPPCPPRGPAPGPPKLSPAPRPRQSSRELSGRDMAELRAKQVLTYYGIFSFIILLLLVEFSTNAVPNSTFLGQNSYSNVKVHRIALITLKTFEYSFLKRFSLLTTPPLSLTAPNRLPQLKQKCTNR